MSEMKKLRRIIREEMNNLNEQTLRVSTIGVRFDMPFVVGGRDYHDFKALARVLSALVGSTVDFTELSMEKTDRLANVSYAYAAIFYPKGRFSDQELEMTTSGELEMLVSKRMQQAMNAI